MLVGIFKSIHSKLTQPRALTKRTCSTVLSPRARLLLTIHILCYYPKYKTIAAQFHVSRATISREFKHGLVLLYCNLREIQWQEKWIPSPFEGVVGVVDCGAHFRFRVHPKQANYYRRDKNGFFLTAQVVCSPQGVIYNVTLGLGHNNDQGMFNFGLQEFIETRLLKLLADRGYHHVLLVTPDDKKSTEWNDELKGDEVL